MKGLSWITRVPLSIKKAQEIIKKLEKVEWKEEEKRGKNRKSSKKNNEKKMDEKRRIRKRNVKVQLIYLLINVDHKSQYLYVY
jgi:hypothetical protein